MGSTSFNLLISWITEKEGAFGVIETLLECVQNWIIEKHLFAS